MLSETAMSVFRSRYKVNGEEPEDMFRRVAHVLSSIEKYRGWPNSEGSHDRFYEMMASQRGLPNSPTLFNAGRDSGQLSACFVLPIEDSLSSIYETLRDAVLIQHTGGGVGYSFSNLRPSGEQVLSSRGLAGGPVCFLRVYDAGLNPIKQGGRRPGANMATLSVSHPDVLHFIACKEKEGEITNFNISVEIDDAFMKAVQFDMDWNLVNPKTGEVAHTLKARDLLKTIAAYAWKNGEPGVIFLERMNAFNPTPKAPYPSVNPCGEQPLPAYEACNLGSINLSKHLNEDADGFDLAELERTTRILVRMLDDVVEASVFPIAAVAANVRKHRRIGLGVMGWADALIKMEIPYTSEQALQLGEVTQRFIHNIAREESAQLAKERGNFPGWQESLFYPNFRMRNATVTTIAPTGSISMLADCSSGIEPVYQFEYERMVMAPAGNITLRVSHPLFEAAQANGGADPAIFQNAENIGWRWHLLHQAAFQKYCDNGVSKTVNMPYDATVQDIYDAIITAYENGLKGFTVYRTGSRQLQVLDARTQCPVCEKKSVVKQSGCDTCTNPECGWSACGVQTESPSVYERQSAAHPVSPSQAG
jgi:ribonucleoside-diphosphate reductase alpha chain